MCLMFSLSAVSEALGMSSTGHAVPLPVLVRELLNQWFLLDYSGQRSRLNPTDNMLVCRELLHSWLRGQGFRGSVEGF
jgi:hypothetical protein